MCAVIAAWVSAAAFATPAAASWFGAPTTTQLGSTVKGVAAGPINTDPSDHREFVVAATGGTSVSVMLAEPSGSLGSPEEIPIAGEPVSVGIGDVNGDGHNDIVVGSINEPAIAVLLGHGDGTFAGEPGSSGSAVTSPGPYTHYPAFLALGHFDGDSSLDLVTGNGPAPGADPATISTFKGNGDGTFSLAHTYGVGNTYQSANRVNVADLTGSSKADLVSGDEGCGGVGEGHQLGVFLGDGAGGFTAQGERFEQCIWGIDIGDVNGDGIPDIIVIHHYGVFNNTSLVEVALGEGDGTFQSFTQSQVPNSASQITAADFNGDGRTDVAVGSTTGDIASGGSGHEPELTVMAGNGDGTLSEVETVPVASNPGSVTYGDLNGSGNPPDIVIGDGSEITVFSNNIAGPVPPTPWPAPAPAPAGCPTIAIYGLRGSGEDYEKKNLGMGPIVYKIANMLLSKLPATYTVLRTGVPYRAEDAWKFIFNGLGVEPYNDSVLEGAELLVLGRGMSHGVNGFTGIGQLVARCPQVKLVLIGHSQGAQVITTALAQAHRRGRVAKRIRAILLYGNPIRQINKPYDVGTNAHNGALADPELQPGGIGEQMPRFLWPYTRSYCLKHDPVCAFSVDDFLHHRDVHGRYGRSRFATAGVRLAVQQIREH